MTIDERELFNRKNVVFFGDKKVFDREFPNIKNLKITHCCFTDKSIVDVPENITLLKTYQDFLKLENTFVLLGHDNPDIIAKWANEFATVKYRGGGYTYINCVSKKEVNTKFLHAMNCNKYIDINENVYEINCNQNITFKLRYGHESRNKFFIGNVKVTNLLHVDVLGSNSLVKIGDFTTIVDGVIQTSEKTQLEIGEDCMISLHMGIYLADLHHIFDLNTKKRINKGKNIVIGNHVWVGRDVKLLAGFHIDSGSIIGAASVTSGKFGKNCIIAGSPARVIRENIIWSRDGFDRYDWDSFDQCIDKKALDYL